MLKGTPHLMGTPPSCGDPHPVVLQVLGSVKNKIESFAASQEDFPALLFKAKKYLIARGRLDWAEGPGAVPALRRPDTLGESMALDGGLGSAWGAGGCAGSWERHVGLEAAPGFSGVVLYQGLGVHGGLGAALGVHAWWGVGSAQGLGRGPGSCALCDREGWSRCKGLGIVGGS